MKKPLAARLLAVLVLVAGSTLIACGAPAPGKSCGKNGFYCLDQGNALECRDGTWRQIPCRGSGGCTRGADAVSCDMTANVPGDACASVQEGRGMCSRDGTSMYECRNGTIIQGKTCSACTISGDLVECQP